MNTSYPQKICRRPIDIEADETTQSQNILSKTTSLLGLTNKRNMYWWYDPEVGYNFGDWIGPYIYKKRTGHMPKWRKPVRSPLEKSFFTVGSIMHLIGRENTAVIWGSGAISSQIQFPKPREILAVRGPLTKEVCELQGYRCPDIFGDPALLIPRYYQPKTEKSSKIGIVSHFAHTKPINRMFGEREEITIIQVNQYVEKVVDQICACDVIISTSLHGLILANAYGIPATWAQIQEKLVGDTFKFEDYFLGAGFETPPSPLMLEDNTTSDQLAKAANQAPTFNQPKILHQLESVCPF